jgi:5'-nucleotidase/UDP-sugar diphosphatase
VRRQADLVIVLSHCGLEVDSMLAASVPGIDVIVGGHDHRALPAPLFIRQPRNANGIAGTLLVQAGQWSRHLGCLDLEVEEGRITAYDGRLLEVTAALPPATRVVEVVEAFAARLGPIVEQVLAQNDSSLSSSGALTEEIALGNLVADLMRDAVRADIAVQNGGGIRGDLRAGPVRLRDLYTVLPFDNTIVTMTLSGRHVEKMLEESVARRGRGGFLHVSGVSFTATDEGRVRDIRVNGAPLDRDRLYRVAANNFTAGGGDGFTVFEEARNVEDTGTRLREAVVVALKERTTVSARVEGRIRFVAE